MMCSFPKAKLEILLAINKFLIFSKLLHQLLSIGLDTVTSTVTNATNIVLALATIKLTGQSQNCE